jgi:hypothetical protein
MELAASVELAVTGVGFAVHFEYLARGVAW